MAPRVARQAAEADPEASQETARQGVAGASSQVPFLDTIQPLFGHHDVSGTKAQVGGAAQEATSAMGAAAYAFDGQIAFGATPSLHTAAHEAAHVVQQQGGLQLLGGLGQSGDLHEQHADAVADRVVAGQPAEGLLDQVSGGGGRSIQTKAIQFHDPLDGGVEDGPNDGGALPGGLPPGPDQDRVMRGQIPWTGALAETIMMQHTARGAAERATWFTQFSADGQMGPLLRNAPAGDLQPPAGRSFAGALDILQRLPAASVPAIVAAIGGNLELEMALRGRVPWSAALATRVITMYAALAPADRTAWFTRYQPLGQVEAMMRAAPRALVGAAGPHNTTIQDLLQRVQRAGAQAEAAGQGLADETAMVTAQVGFMSPQPVQPGQPAPPPPQNPTSQTTVQPTTTVMTPQQAAALDTQARAFIPTFITNVNGEHPDLGLTVAHIRADALAVHGRGQDVVAFSESGKAVVGREFVRMMQADWHYAVATIVHEVFGHPEYGPFGTPGTEYALELYDRAAPQVAGRTRPPRDQEIDSIALPETDLHAFMREVEYYRPNATGHNISSNYDPRLMINQYVSQIRTQWEPRVARSLIRGLYQRFMADPRITDPGRDAFRAAVRAAGFPATDVASILR